LKRNFVLKRTEQLSQNEKSQICGLFFKLFGKDMSEEEFNRKYLHTPFGYSYHGLMVADKLIVGTFNAIPYRYQYFGEDTLFALSVDLMVAKEHRGGPFNIKKMASLVLKEMKRDGVSFVFGFPNESAYDYVRRFLKWKDIGELDFYILPRNIGSVIPKLRFMNCISRAFTLGLSCLPTSRSKRNNMYNIEKVSDICFQRHRYNGNYHIVDLDRGGKCIYRVYVEDNRIRVLYIIDVNPLTCATFDEAVQQVCRQHSKSIDIFMYVGLLPFKTARMLIVPEQRRPRRVRMCGTLLEPGAVDDRIFQIKNWNVNISNFDVR
jgi:hypothetical protein